MQRPGCCASFVFLATADRGEPLPHFQAIHHFVGALRFSEYLQDSFAKGKSSFGTSPANAKTLQAPAALVVF